MDKDQWLANARRLEAAHQFDVETHEGIFVDYHDAVFACQSLLKELYSRGKITTREVSISFSQAPDAIHENTAVEGVSKIELPELVDEQSGQVFLREVQFEHSRWLQWTVLHKVVTLEGVGYVEVPTTYQTFRYSEFGMQPFLTDMTDEELREATRKNEQSKVTILSKLVGVQALQKDLEDIKDLLEPLTPEAN